MRTLGHFQVLTALVAVSLVGCTSLPFNLGQVLQPSAQPPANKVVVTATDTPTPVMTPETPSDTPPVGGQFVRLWLPPEFDPDGDSPAGTLLKARLDEFEGKNPSIRLEVRVKAVDGSGGMLDSLVAAGAAAPSSLPDLVLLPRELLESAALKGLLFPYDGLTSIMQDKSWFEYARQLATLKSKIYGIPFAGDVMVLAHSFPHTQNPPISLEATLTGKNALLFPAADPRAMFTLCVYLAEGGKLQDDQGRPALEEAVLAKVLDYYQKARVAKVTTDSLAEYSDDDQVWQALLGNQYPMAVLWASTYLHALPAEQSKLEIASLPTPDGTPFTLATGWSWALAGQDPDRRELSIRLVEYLVDKTFLAAWTEASGYLPPRQDALQNWSVASSPQVLEQIAASARLAPSSDLVAILGPALQQAVIKVLEGKSDPQTAARAAISQINQP